MGMGTNSQIYYGNGTLTLRWLCIYMASVWLGGFWVGKPYKCLTEGTSLDMSDPLVQYKCGVYTINRKTPKSAEG